jgi:Zn finger protein HypA/HybF involved in hydrogenase expression
VFQIDLKRDSHACLECRSENTVDLESFAGEACPKCGRGKIKAKQIAKI